VSNPAENDQAPTGTNPGFALGRIAAALATRESHPDADTRERATAKVGKWLDVLKGMISGTLAIGSRTPVADEPAWATPEVIYGGFATGALLAGGDLQPYESALLARLGDGDGTPRARLNAWFLSEAGFPELRRMLADGTYRVDVPEEAALLTAAWLAENGRDEEAHALLREIAPHFHRLRFYPVPAARPLYDGPEVHLASVGEVAYGLRKMRPPRELLEQREALQVWAPMADRVVALFLETVTGPAPTLRTAEDGTPLREPDGRFAIDGGWPCQHYPDGWRERAAEVLADYRRLRATHTLVARPDRPAESFARLRRYLETCVEAPERLTGREVGLIRLLLAGIGARRGFPGSERLQRVRAAQAATAAAPLRAELAHVVAARLAELPADEGLDSVDSMLSPVTVNEAAAHGVPAGHALNGTLRHRLRLALSAPVEELVAQGILPSGEALARVVPALTAQVRASGIADPALRRLYGAVYRAFRRRRSLLLLNLESQVRLEELPWVRPMDTRRAGAAGEYAVARQALARVTALALLSYPQQIIPNKLLREIRALVAAADLKLPLVDELAADIFMHAFTSNFLHAAHVAAEVLQGTLYERYYAIPYARVRALDDVTKAPFGASTSAGFLALCLERAGEAPAGHSFVARNGTILEQAQILTTHNLAVLFRAPGVDEAVRPRLDAMARACFAWTCARLKEPAPEWGARLRTVKNGAYAWRQMVFYLSMLPEDAVRAFVDWARGHLAEQPAAFQARFGPALVGLVRAVDGGSPEDGGGRVYLGWTADGRHWLLPPEPAAAADESR
jgi:hypothetical protein